MNQLAKATERLMAMDDRTWQRHANPWSGWTRVLSMPLFSIAVWSRDWIGWWCLVPSLPTIVWVWINPRLFPPPASLDNWMSRGVLGERVWLADLPGTIADHHRPVIRATTWIASLGGLVWLVGLCTFDLTATLAGLTASMLGKLWFLDRMVWIERESPVERLEPSITHD